MNNRPFVGGVGAGVGKELAGRATAEAAGLVEGRAAHVMGQGRGSVGGA